MGVYIKCMEMPERCWDCDLCYDSFCCRSLGIQFSDREDFEPAERRLSDCPLIPVPPHGRLIDAGKISDHKYTTIPPYRRQYADGKPKSEEEVLAFKFGWNYAIDAVMDNAPTVIPAEEKTDE